MVNRSDELKALLVKALESSDGIILAVSGGERNKIQSALSAISAARRELMIDIPEIINVQVKRIPGRDEIALVRLRDPLEEEGSKEAGSG